MSVVIMKSGHAYRWICKVRVEGLTGKKQPCNLVDSAATEDEARKAYEAHKKRTPGH